MQRRCSLSLTGFCRRNHAHEAVENNGNVVVLIDNCRVDKKTINYALLENYLNNLIGMAQIGGFRIVDVGVAANTGRHLRGHVYIAFEGHEEAQAARNHFHGGRVNDQYSEINAQITPMRDIEGGTCTRYTPGDTSSCKYGRHCDYIHMVGLVWEP